MAVRGMDVLKGSFICCCGHCQAGGDAQNPPSCFISFCLDVPRITVGSAGLCSVVLPG